jgi:hypothetical protein
VSTCLGSSRPRFFDRMANVSRVVDSSQVLAGRPARALGLLASG